MPRLVLVVLLALGARGCITYEYEHEFWIDVDGSGTVFATGRPSLWAAFKGVAASDETREASRAAAREVFERSGLRVRRVTWTYRKGKPYLFVAADFDDVNKLSGTPAFPDLQIGLSNENGRLRLHGTWQPSSAASPPPPADHAGLMAVRFHLPSKVYEHNNAAEGVERGNIVAWRQEVARGLSAQPLPFGALIDSRSILLSTVGLFAGAIVIGLSAVALAVYLTFRKGKRAARVDPASPAA